MNSDSVIHARWIIPVEPADQVLANHSIAISGDRIVAILPTEQAKTSITARHEITLADHALIPGLINSHTHAAMVLFRGLADDLPLSQWLNDSIWPAEQKWISEAFVQDGTRLAIAEMLRGGTTCFSDMYFYPDRTAELASQLGIRAVIGLIVIDFPSAWGSGPEDYLHKGEQLHMQYKADPLITTTLSPHATYTVANQHLKRIAERSEEWDIPVHIHAHETADEVKNSIQHTQKRPLQWLQELGLINERLLAVHMTELEPYEIALLGESGANVVHCPTSNMKLASGLCPVQRLLEAGVNVCIGTDGAASNNSLDLLSEIKTTALLAKVLSGDSTAVKASTTLAMGTIYAARGLGLDHEIGSLVIGKQADIVAIDLDQPETQPVYDPISTIIYSANRKQVSDVWIAGRHLLKNYELLGFNLDALSANAKAWQEKILA